MLASSFFFGKNVREKRERDVRTSSKESKEAIKAFRSCFLDDEYWAWRECFSDLRDLAFD